MEDVRDTRVEEGCVLPGHSDLRFRRLPAADVAKAAVLEACSYPADEAATLEKLEYRQRVAPELFYGTYEGPTLVGFVVSTATAGEELKEESMSTHVPGGASICIHSVVVAASHQRRGIGRATVRAYVAALAEDPCSKGARRVLLLAHAPLLGFYVQCGFELLGPSTVCHGSEPWFDMRLDLVLRRQLDFVQIDAFTPVALAGNPAAVLFTQKGGAEEWMQAVAVENNLSETAFLERRGDGAQRNGEASEWHIRWFTPGGEVALCGHATLGSAHALWDTGRVPANAPIVFHTQKAGTLQCSATDGWIRMDFPIQPPVALGEDPSSAATKAALVAALGLSEADLLYLGRGPVTTPDWLLEVSPGAFACLGVDASALARVRPMGRGVIVTCGGAPAGSTAAGEGTRVKRPRILSSVTDPKAFDFSSRFFAPIMGIDEDPVTGSAHCVLAPYWAAKLQKPDGASMRALQASARGGELRVRCLSETGRVELEGQAVTVLRGKMVV